MKPDKKKIIVVSKLLKIRCVGKCILQFEGKDFVKYYIFIPIDHIQAPFPKISPTFPFNDASLFNFGYFSFHGN